MGIIKKAAVGAGKFVVGAGVGMVISNAVAATTPVIGVGLLAKGAISVGTFVLSNMVADKATDYFVEEAEELTEAIEEAKQEAEEE